jgi:hypothetical protein
LTQNDVDGEVEHEFDVEVAKEQMRIVPSPPPSPPPSYFELISESRSRTVRVAKSELMINNRDVSFSFPLNNFFFMFIVG